MNFTQEVKMTDAPSQKSFSRALLELGLLAILFAPLGFFQERFFYYFFGYTPLALGLLPLPSLAIGRLRRRYGWPIVLLVAFAGVMLGHALDPWQAPERTPNNFAQDWSVVGSVRHPPFTVNGFDPAATREKGEPVWNFVTTSERPQKYQAVLYKSNFAEFRFALEGTQVVDSRVEFDSDFGIPVPNWEDPPIKDGQFVGQELEQAMESIKNQTNGEWEEPIYGTAWLLSSAKGELACYQHKVLACYGNSLYFGNNRALALGDETDGDWNPLLYKHFSSGKGRWTAKDAELANSREIPERLGSETVVQLREDRVVKIWGKYPED